MRLEKKHGVQHSDKMSSIVNFESGYVRHRDILRFWHGI